MSSSSTEPCGGCTNAGRCGRKQAVTTIAIDGRAGRLECLVAGVEAAPPVVMVHGIQGTAGIWAETLPVLGHRWRALAPNLRGRAGSHRPEGTAAYALPRFTDDLDAVMDGLTGPAVLIGWSMGSLVALDWLRRHGSGRLAGLALVSGTPAPRLAAPDPALWFRGETATEIAAEAEARAARLSLTEAATPLTVAGAWLSAREADYRADLAGIDVPTLVLHGTIDPECPPSHARALARAIPGARLEMWQDCGHMPMSTAPACFASTLDAFCATCFGYEKAIYL